MLKLIATCQVPLQLLLEYDLPVHHGGWIFIGMALLHDKKETRDLTAEYILRAISRDEDLSYLQHFLADILAQKLTPYQSLCRVFWISLPETLK